MRGERGDVRMSAREREVMSKRACRVKGISVVRKSASGREVNTRQEARSGNGFSQLKEPVRKKGQKIYLLPSQLYSLAAARFTEKQWAHGASLVGFPKLFHAQCSF